MTHPLLPILFAVFAAAAALLAFGLLLTQRYASRHRERFEQVVSERLRTAFLFIDPARLFAAHYLIVLAAVALAAWLSGRWQIALLVAFVVGAVPGIALALIRRQRREAYRRQMPDVLMLIAGGMRAGSGLAQALAQAAAEIGPPARQELGLLLREQRLGVALDQALIGLARRMPIEESALLVSVLRIGIETGGNLADSLESLADATRRKLGIEGKIHALTAQGRLQAWVMGALPAVVAVLLFLVEPQTMSPLIDTWQGWAVCVTVAALQLLGIVMIRRIVAIDI